MRTILILMDSLNRHYLNAYGDSRIQTPNLDRLAERGTVFDGHWSGSLPCMPARREMLTGRLNFLETPWGPIEAWDTTLPHLLRNEEIYTHMITDHYHYFHRGGDGYHDLFDSWEFQRGQEGDAWRPVVNVPQPPKDARGKGLQRWPYWRNSSVRDDEDDLSYPTPRSFQDAINFLDMNADADNWHLHLEVFDPHEPFECPQKYRDLYNDTWDKYHYTWPAYNRLDPELDDDEAIAHIRKSYAGVLTMADVWLGKFLDKMDEYNMWDDTTLILTTDHGHLLGEHGYWAKNYMFDYAELAHIPLILCAPDVPGGQRIQSLTTTIDIMPTLLDVHEVEIPDTVQGKSFLHLIDEDADHHDWILYGYFGKDVNITDGTTTYTRQAIPGSTVHLHTGDLKNIRVSENEMRSAEAGHFLADARGIPHFRIARQSRRHKDAPGFNPIYDLANDPHQESPIRDDQKEGELADTMRELLKRYDAPSCQFTRLGLKQD